MFEAKISELIGFNSIISPGSDISVFEEKKGMGMLGVIYIKLLIERIENIYNSCAKMGYDYPVPEYTALYNFLYLSQNSDKAEDGFPIIPVLLDIITQCHNLISI